MDRVLSHSALPRGVWRPHHSNGHSVRFHPGRPQPDAECRQHSCWSTDKTKHNYGSTSWSYMVKKMTVSTQIQTPHIKTPFVGIIVWIEKICQNIWAFVGTALEFVDDKVTVFLCLFFYYSWLFNCHTHFRSNLSVSVPHKESKFDWYFMVSVCQFGKNLHLYNAESSNSWKSYIFKKLAIGNSPFS